MKKSGHATNSVENPIINPSIQHDSLDHESAEKYLSEFIIDFKGYGNVYSEESINIAAELSDEFLRTSFKIISLKEYFNDDAWLLVVKLFDSKIKASTCSICIKVCLEHSIQCDTCQSWLHWKCDNVTHYARKKKSYLCSICKNDQ